MTVVIKRLDVSARSAQSLKIGAAPKGFYTGAPRNDNKIGAALPALTAAYDALAQDSYPIKMTDDKNSWSLDWY